MTKPSDAVAASYIGLDEGKPLDVTGFTRQAMWQLRPGEWMAIDPAVGPSGELARQLNDSQRLKYDGGPYLSPESARWQAETRLYGHKAIFGGIAGYWAR